MEECQKFVKSMPQKTVGRASRLCTIGVCAIFLHAITSAMTLRLRAIAPILLLGASTVLTASLALQAYGASVSHRALAEQVLSDYASLAASEFSRRATAFIGNYGVTVLLNSLTAIERSDGGLVPTRARMKEVIPPESVGALELVETVFSLDARTGEFVSDALNFHERDRELLLEAAKRSSPESQALLTQVLPARWYVMAQGKTGGSARRWFGVEISPPALGEWLQKFVTNEPLLPPTLMRNKALPVVYTTLRDPLGHVWFRAPQRNPTGAIIVRRQIGGTPSVPGFSQFTVEVAIESAAAQALIIGGMPHDQTRLLIGLALLSAALMTAAILQLRSERRAASMREDFVTRASHELRTPVARIRMFAEMLLLDRVRSDAERRETIKALDRGARRLSILIDNVLWMSSQQRGSPRREHADLVTLAHETLVDFNTATGEHTGIRLAAPERLIAEIDCEAVRQCLMNLLDNAWKYGGETPEILMTISGSDTEVTIVVADRGPGIPPPARARIWEPYIRLERERTSSIAGTGIGLAVVRDLVHSGGGRCWVEDNPGGGARFIIALRASDSDADAVA